MWLVSIVKRLRHPISIKWCFTPTMQWRSGEQTRSRRRSCFCLKLYKIPLYIFARLFLFHFSRLFPTQNLRGSEAVTCLTSFLWLPVLLKSASHILRPNFSFLPSTALLSENEIGHLENNLNKTNQVNRPTSAGAPEGIHNILLENLNVTEKWNSDNGRHYKSSNDFCCCSRSQGKAWLSWSCP